MNANGFGTVIFGADGGLLFWFLLPSLTKSGSRRSCSDLDASFSNRPFALFLEEFFLARRSEVDTDSLLEGMSSSSTTCDSKHWRARPLLGDWSLLSAL